VKVRDIPKLWQCKNEQGHVLWTAVAPATRAEARGWWRVYVVYGDGKPGNKFFPDGEMEVGNGSG
jgi:hypothetical protein